MPQSLQALLASAGFLVTVGGASAAILAGASMAVPLVLVILALIAAGDLVVIARRTGPDF
jgi:hypothetical protein